MGQLIKVTTEPFQVIRFTQKARLVPSDHVDRERRKAMAQYHAFNSSHRGGGGSTDLEYMNKINDAFSSKSSPVQEKHPVSPQKPVAFRANHTAAATAAAVATTAAASAAATATAAALATATAAAPIPVSTPVSAPVSAPVPVSTSAPVPAAQTAPSASLPVKDMQAAYTMQRGSLELRVAKGELSFLPPLVMTIITQYPDIQFEYTGGFQYVPPQKDTESSNINLYI